MRYPNVTFLLPLLHLMPLMDGFPWDIFRKFCTEVKARLRYTVAKKYCQKLQSRE